MDYVCPACQAAFDVAGFCPHDGTELATRKANAAAQTLLSTAMEAQHVTATDVRRGTFPLTPTPPAQLDTHEITSARTREGVAPTPPPREVRALSASEDPQAALAAFRAKRAENEYDKLVGHTLDGRYFVERKIGEGGMGVVFAARHAVIERPLAIKVLKREVMRDAATIKRFVQEAQAASRIGHPNIVDVTDFGTTADGMTFSVMEYVTGQTLGTAIREGAPFNMQRTIKIAVQIARALGAAHDKGIVHRDLKPENVFLIDRENRHDFVKIVDFGIAKIIPVTGAPDPNEPRLTRAGSVFGTPEYMAPEQAAGRSDTDGRVDIYALGVIMYEMVTGRVPHRGESMVRTLAMQMLDPVESPRKVRPDLDISIELEEVILRALAKKRDQRYQRMSELLGALEKLQTIIGQSITGSPVYAITPLPPGADPSLLSKTDPSLLAPAYPVTPLAERTEPRSRAPTNRVKNEPQFVTGEKPITFEHVFSDTSPPATPRRWPLILLFALILGGAAGAVALVVNGRSTDTHPDAGLVAIVHDAAVVVDAMVALPMDAAVVDPDATDIVILIDAAVTVGVRPAKDAGPGSAAVITPNGRGTISIQVITKPEGATLYNGTTYSGPGGTNIEMPYGSRAEITCRHPGYKPGKVTLVFDGSKEAELCQLTRIKICINGVKNPFDDCELPGAGSGPSPIDDPLPNR